MKADNESLEPLPYIDNNVDLLDTLCNLPSELKQLGECSEIIEELVNERKHIIYKLREIACYLEKMHSDVLIADRVGTGVAITSGLLTIGGLVSIIYRTLCDYLYHPHKQIQTMLKQYKVFYEIIYQIDPYILTILELLLYFRWLHHSLLEFLLV